MSLLLLFQAGGPFPAPSAPVVTPYPGAGLLAIAALAGEHARIGDVGGAVVMSRHVGGGRGTSKPVAGDAATGVPIGGGGKTTVH